MTRNNHAGDCTYYASLHNKNPENGICTCGYGLEVLRATGSYEQLYSRELIIKLNAERCVEDSLLIDILSQNGVKNAP